MFALATAGVALAEGPSVAIVAPRNLQTVAGTTTIEAVPDPGDGRIDRVEFLVDGATVATRTAPPWTAAFDAGDGSKAHVLEVVMVLRDGRSARASVRTSRLRINEREDVDLVTMYAVVRDADGRYVSGLTKDDFRVFEDDRPERIERFTTQPKPLAIALVLDTSLTMEGSKLDAAREAALALLRGLEPEDRCALLTFSDDVRVAEGLTEDRDAIEVPLREVRAEGGTALYDAIWRGADLLRGEDSRRVMVLLSDGRDEAASGLEPGSLHTQEEALDQALRTETMVFAIGFGRRLDEQLDFYRRETLAEILTRLGERTGGRVLFPKRPSALRKAFDEVAQDLRNQYQIAYVSDDPVHDGRWREIRLETTRPELRVITRRGYFAEPPGG